VGEAGNIIKTINGGENWILQNSGTGDNLYSVYFTDNQTGWVVGAYGTIMKTTNGGENWFLQSSGADNWLYSVQFIDNQIGWAVGLWGTIIKTTNGGENWFSQSSGTSITLNSVHFTDNQTGWAVGENGTILKTTNGGGVTFVGEDENTSSPNNFILSQNYPNPFNPSTQIRYSISNTTLVTIKVYDMLGKEVTTLVNEENSPGNYEVEFNGNNLPAGRQGLASGIYFYRLRAGNFVETKKMILLK